MEGWVQEGWARRGGCEGVGAKDVFSDPKKQISKNI